ncbi:MAG TPA: hypothetical protein VF247_10775 [Candidatus Krumholzibacteria bacterium]
MRLFPGITALAVVACATAAQAADVFSPSLATYSTSSLAAGAIALPENDDAHFAGNFDLEDAAAPAQQSWWPLLYSALVPGLGELTMGYEKRGIALMAAEVAAWSGYFINHNDGLDERDEYEAFADAHWDFDKWIADHPASCIPPGATLADVEECGRALSGSGQWPGYIPYVSKESDKQHYYENIGKYDWYISGWEDWDATAVPYLEDTDLRTQYRAMRQKSNDSLDQANAFVWLSVAARAFSLAETAIIIHNRRGDAETGGGGGTPVSLRARPRGYSGGEVALEVRFK